MKLPREYIYPTDRSWVNVTTGTGTTLFVETGYARATYQGGDLYGAPDDDTLMTLDFGLHVGPYFHNVLQVAPLVHLARWGSEDSDEDDRQGFEVSAVRWSLLEYDPPGGVQVVLVFSVSWRGTKTYLNRIGYQVTVEAESVFGEVEGRSGFTDLLVDL